MLVSRRIRELSPRIVKDVHQPGHGCESSHPDHRLVERGLFEKLVPARMEDGHQCDGNEDHGYLLDQPFAQVPAQSEQNRASQRRQDCERHGCDPTLWLAELDRHRQHYTPRNDPDGHEVASMHGDLRSFVAEHLRNSLGGKPHEHDLDQAKDVEGKQPECDQCRHHPKGDSAPLWPLVGLDRHCLVGCRGIWSARSRVPPHLVGYSTSKVCQTLPAVMRGRSRFGRDVETGPCQPSGSSPTNTGLGCGPSTAHCG